MVLRHAPLRPAAKGCNVSFHRVSINITHSLFALPGNVDNSVSLKLMLQEVSKFSEFKISHYIKAA